MDALNTADLTANLAMQQLSRYSTLPNNHNIGSVRLVSKPGKQKSLSGQSSYMPTTVPNTTYLNAQLALVSLKTWLTGLWCF